MHSLKALALVITLLMASLPASAARNGNDLLKLCSQAVTFQDDDSKPINSVEATACMGYMQGFQEMNAIYRVLLTNNVLFCPPAGVTNGQSIRVVTKYLREHPAELHEEASILVVKALKAAFPCPVVER